METPFQLAEEFIRGATQWLKLSIETTGVIIIGIGVAVALWQFARAMVARRAANFTAIRLSLARYLALALEFQLGADILSTAIAPTPKEIGQLAAIAVIRTGLNYFLSLEMKEEGAVERHEAAVLDNAEVGNLERGSRNAET